MSTMVLRELDCVDQPTKGIRIPPAPQTGMRGGVRRMLDFGFSVSTAGDVNDDGYDDVIVGAPHYTNGGAAFVYHGSEGGLSEKESWTAEGGQAGAQFGSSVYHGGEGERRCLQ